MDNPENIEIIDVTNHPSATCPSWCVMGVDGACVGEFSEPPEGHPVPPGWHVYSRPRREEDGTPGVDVAVMQEGGSLIRLSLPADDNATEEPRR